MKRVIISLIFGFSLSVSAQSQMSKPDNTQISDQDNTQVVAPQSNKGSTTTPVVDNPNPVLISPRRYGTYKDSYTTGNEVYQGSYEPPTRNERLYRQPNPCLTKFEINTRPLILFNGFIGVGAEVLTACKTSLLFDITVGNPTFLNRQTTSSMIGFRFYRKKGMVGRYISTRARFRSYERGDYYGGNISLMAGYKARFSDVTLSSEFGLGYRYVDGSSLTVPMWATTLGYRL